MGQTALIGLAAAAGVVWVLEDYAADPIACVGMGIALLLMAIASAVFILKNPDALDGLGMPAGPCCRCTCREHGRHP